MERPPTTSRSRCSAAEERFHAITTGLLMVAGGTLLMAHRRGMVDARELWRWAPLLMLLPAARALVVRQGPCRGWLVALGWTVGTVLSVLSAHGYPVLSGGTLFALGLVAGGVWLLWRPETRGGRR